MRTIRHFSEARPVILSFIFMMVLASCATSEKVLTDTSVTGAESAAENGELRTVPFLTLRNRTGREEAPKYFGGERDTLRAGICELDRTPLDSMKPLAARAPFRIPDEIVKVDAIIELAVQDFWQRMETRSDGQAPVLYMHGFNISFERGCRRALMLKESLALEGRFLLFSWPSDGQITSYTHDEADLSWSVHPLHEVLLEMIDRFGQGKVNIVAHSLGTRGVMFAMLLLAQAQQHQGPLLNQLVLIAPDIDVGIFKQYLPKIRPLVRNMTVYVSSNDSPLMLSRQVHGHPRLGEAGEHLEALQGIEIIDLSAVPRRAPSGHVYHLYQDVVIKDLDRLLHANQPAAQRGNLKQTRESQWLMLPTAIE
ncbi:MAG: alpha/beta hydrolase [Gammaproteobacteria bacterium]|nr:alpha/beta hydrolase [Gammaproteobacteria bacterium]